MLASTALLRAQIAIVHDADTPAPLLAGVRQRLADEALARDAPLPQLEIAPEGPSDPLWRLRTWQAVLWLAGAPIPEDWRRSWEIEGVRVLLPPTEDLPSALHVQAAGTRLADEALAQ
ncbi:MAG: hypothetical protein Q7P63_11285 [Verrucomicrobiota bacterium JB022]|nr:hypothetical protein [Verrucomicrobiota bacterium JB022]